MITRIFLLFLLPSSSLFSSSGENTKFFLRKYQKAIVVGSVLSLLCIFFYYCKTKNKKPLLRPVFAKEITVTEKVIYVTKTITFDLNSFLDEINEPSYVKALNFVNNFERGLRNYFRNSEMTDYFLNTKNSDGKTITNLILEMPQSENELKIDLLWSLCGFPYFFNGHFPPYEPGDPRTEKALNEHQERISMNQEDLKNVFFFLSNLLEKIHYDISTITPKDIEGLQRGFFNKKMVPDKMYRKTVFLAITVQNNSNDPEIKNTGVPYKCSKFKFENSLGILKDFAAECN